MDRYYLGKLIDDINIAMARTLKEVLGEHLVFFMAVSGAITPEDTHMKLLRYLYSPSPECPAQNLLGLISRVDAECTRFSGSDVICQSHFGNDDQIPRRDGGYFLGLQFHCIEAYRDHSQNQWLVAAVLEDDNQQESLPSWLNFPANLSPEQLENEILYYCQLFVSKHVDQLIQVRGVEEAFWRLINQLCAYYHQNTYEALVDMFPVRFRETLKRLPQEWQNLRNKAHSFSDEDFMTCGRLSLRFCQQSMELLK